MLKWMFGRFIDRFAKRYSYDVSYMRDLLATDTAAFMAFSKVQGLSGYRKAPRDALAAAGIVGTLAEDCGPCTQISVDIATEAGVAPATLRAILAGDEAGMGEAAALAWRFAKASLARDMERCDPLREEIVRRWGEAGLVAIGLTLTKARMYPTLKYALGYGKACSRVTVAGEPASLALAA